MRASSIKLMFIIGLTLEPKCTNEPTKTVVKSCVHLLRCVAVGLGINATGIPSIVANSIATHLLHILSTNIEQGY